MISLSVGWLRHLSTLECTGCSFTFLREEGDTRSSTDFFSCSCVPHAPRPQRHRTKPKILTGDQRSAQNVSLGSTNATLPPLRKNVRLAPNFRGTGLSHNSDAVEPQKTTNAHSKPRYLGHRVLTLAKATYCHSALANCCHGFSGLGPRDLARILRQIPALRIDVWRWANKTLGCVPLPVSPGCRAFDSKLCHGSGNLQLLHTCDSLVALKRGGITNPPSLGRTLVALATLLRSSVAFGGSSRTCRDAVTCAD